MTGILGILKSSATQSPPTFFLIVTSIVYGSQRTILTSNPNLGRDWNINFRFTNSTITNVFMRQKYTNNSSIAVRIEGYYSYSAHLSTKKTISEMLGVQKPKPHLNSILQFLNEHMLFKGHWLAFL
jgi:hypothetical protein